MAIMTRPFAHPPARATGVAAAPLRRCTFPDRRRAVALGDIESARPICESCTYQGIFRPDSD